MKNDYNRFNLYYNVFSVCISFLSSRKTNGLDYGQGISKIYYPRFLQNDEYIKELNNVIRIRSFIYVIWFMDNRTFKVGGNGIKS